MKTIKVVMANGHGGARRNAGRKKGAATTRTREIANVVVASGKSPLEYMMTVVHDVNAEQHRRDDMAKAAAPFVHPRLSAMSARVDATKHVNKTEVVFVREIKSGDALGPNGEVVSFEEAGKLWAIHRGQKSIGYDVGEQGISIGDDDQDEKPPDPDPA